MGVPPRTGVSGAVGSAMLGRAAEVQRANAAAEQEGRQPGSDPQPASRKGGTRRGSRAPSAPGCDEGASWWVCSVRGLSCAASECARLSFYSDPKI